MARKVPYIKVTRKYARKYHVRPRDLVAQQQTESNFQPGAVSSAGAFGLTQFMPGTAKGYHVHRGTSRSAVKSQIRGQANYLHDLGYSHDRRGALAKYAGGPGNPQASYANLVVSRSKVYKGIGKGPASKGGGSGGSGGGSRTTTVKTTKRTPGIDRSAQRQALVLDLLKTKPGTQRSSDPLQQSKRNASDSANVLSTITQVQNTPDTPGKKVTSTKRTKVRLPGGKGGGKAVQGHSRYPLGKKGKIIGVPYKGTHTLGNWQSDNAVDIAARTGTPVLSSFNGRVVKINRAHAGETGRFAGIQVTIQADGGNAEFVTHLSGARVKQGQRVRKGQMIGRSGSANGVEHLHIGFEHGHPQGIIKR